RLGTVRFNHGDGLKALFFTPDGKTILSAGYDFLRLWDAATGKELRHFTATGTLFHDQTILSPDGRRLTFFKQDNSGETVRVWDLAEGKEGRVVPLPLRRNEHSVRGRALSPDGRLAAVHTTERILLFDLAAARE